MGEYVAVGAPGMNIAVWLPSLAGSTKSPSPLLVSETVRLTVRALSSVPTRVRTHSWSVVSCSKR